MRRKKRNLNYKADLRADLRESAEFAAEYLSAAYADSRGAFLVAMRDVVEARKGIARVAAQANVNRESLYRALSESGNPRFSTLDSIWDVLGFEMEFRPKETKTKATATIGPATHMAKNVAPVSANFQILATDVTAIVASRIPPIVQTVTIASQPQEKVEAGQFLRLQSQAADGGIRGRQAAA